MTSNTPLPTPERTTSELDEISTCWPMIADPVQFTMRYAPAISCYAKALLKNGAEADEVLQDFLLRGLERGFLRTTALRGRFRDYLKVAVRNSAVSHLRRQNARREVELDPNRFAELEEPSAEKAWISEWRNCVLDRAWDALDAVQRQTAGSLCHTALRLATDFPNEDSEALALRAASVSGRSINSTAFRKQLSRARRKFAELIIGEIAATLQSPTSQRIREELADLGLMTYLSPFLPDEQLPLPPK